MIRFLRDYVNLLCMVNSRIDHVRELAREAVRRYGWRIRPASGKTWSQCFNTILDRDEIWLWFNAPAGSTRIVKWFDPYGVVTYEVQGIELDQWIKERQS